MQRVGLLFLACSMLVPVLGAQAPPAPGAPAPGAPTAQDAQATPTAPRPAPVATMGELMLKVIYPYSDAMFYIQRAEERRGMERAAVQGAGARRVRQRDDDAGSCEGSEANGDAKLLAEAGAAAFRLAKAKDVEGIVGLNEQLVMSCTSCHMRYRSNYGRRTYVPVK